VKRLPRPNRVTARQALADTLTASLERMSPIERTHAIASAALSPEVDERVAIARALKRPLPIVGAMSVIEHLARDPAPEVRAAAAAAAWLRRSQARVHYTSLLQRLSLDRDEAVREVARLALIGF
jgi:hypothetical protein